MVTKPTWINSAVVCTLSALAAGGLLVAPLEARTRLQAHLFDTAHAPLFAFLVGFVSRFLRSRHPQNRFRLIVLIWVLAAALGVLAESAQRLSLRDANVADAGANLLGASAGALWAGGAACGRRAWRFVLQAGAAVALSCGIATPLWGAWDAVRQILEFPLLADFENRRQLGRWRATDFATISRTQQFASQGKWCLCVEMQPSEWSGVLMQHPPTDWSGYHQLRFDVHVQPRYAPLRLYVKLSDANYQDYDRRIFAFDVPAGRSTIDISLTRSLRGQHRMLDLADVGTFLIHTAGTRGKAVFYLDHVRLE